MGANNKGKSILPFVDFFLESSREKIPQRGEDSYFFAMKEEAAICGVFDGCGGSGAKRYENYKGKTGAYIASRMISGAIKDWFFSQDAYKNSLPDITKLEHRIREYLAFCNAQAEQSQTIKGKMSLSFPSTVAVISCSIENGIITAHCVWAGDSRCYLLNRNGLKQLSDDDLAGLDPMDNLTAGGGLTNVANASKPFELHQKTIAIDEPGILFSASDGCFGYLSTPMEFEYLLEETLERSGCPADWERNFDEIVSEVTGDDFSICGFSFGFDDFQRLKDAMKMRCLFMLENYIRPMEKMPLEEKKDLWHKYSKEYSLFLKQQEMQI